MKPCNVCVCVLCWECCKSVLIERPWTTTRLTWTHTAYLQPTLTTRHCSCKVDMPKSNLTIIWALYVSGMWLGLDMRIGTKKTCVQRRLTTCSKYVNHCRLNAQHDWRCVWGEGRGGGRPLWSLNEQENLNFDNEWDIHMNSKNYEANDTI